MIPPSFLLGGFYFCFLSMQLHSKISSAEINISSHQDEFKLSSCDKSQLRLDYKFSTQNVFCREGISIHFSKKVRSISAIPDLES